MFGQIFAALVSGIATGMPLFIVASGLTLIYGVMRVLNFAHGAFFMIGAFLFYNVLGGVTGSISLLIVGLLIAALSVGAIGAVSEVAVFRRLYARDHTTTLLASYALLLTLDGLVQQIWGVSPRSQTQLPAFAGSFQILGVRVATYDVVLIGVGAVLAIGLTLLLQRTSFGQTTRAVAHDQTMARALGLHARGVQLAVFALGAALAGLAGGLISPLLSIDPSLAPTFVVQSFAIVIVGGLGSMGGALIAALLIGLLDSFAVTFFPGFAGFSLYIAVTLVLLLRPQGIFGAAFASREA
ncbi:MAG: hypothetical protein JWQ19_1300 [Subtercola sp.]|nr:hypothetical protein [Subtercola sp.]